MIDYTHLSICVINVIGNWSWLSTCNPPSCLQFCQMSTDLKILFFTGRLGNIFFKYGYWKFYDTSNFHNQFIANFLQNLSVKNCENRLKFFYAVTTMSLVSPFLWDTVYSLGLYGTQQVRLYPCCRFMLDVIVDARVHALWQLPASLYSVV